MQLMTVTNDGAPSSTHRPQALVAGAPGRAPRIRPARPAAVGEVILVQAAPRHIWILSKTLSKTERPAGKWPRDPMARRVAHPAPGWDAAGAAVCEFVQEPGELGRGLSLRPPRSAGMLTLTS